MVSHRGGPVADVDDSLRCAPVRSTAGGAPHRWIESARPAAPALLAAERVVSYGELGHLVGARAAQFGAAIIDRPRSVVVLDASRSLDAIIDYLAVHAAGHVPLIVPCQQVESIVSIHDPALVVRTLSTGERSVEDRHQREMSLHADLTLLAATSGSTGAPRLVRLSRTNVESNARSIAAALGLTAEDRGITSLPISYCYGLSVLHAHLVVGASIVITPDSIVDSTFRSALVDKSVTNLAGVPHTFELFDASGWVPSSPLLRFVTVAGGRLPLDEARRWAAVGRRSGWNLVVMYGQTEATARMAVLPPELLDAHPSAAGRAVPGGEFVIVDPDHSGVGEILYRGPNVFMGYADSPADLSRGTGGYELLTGDLGRWVADTDLIEVVGRRSRFAKLFGLRVDLDHLEEQLAAAGAPSLCWSDDRTLDVATAGDPVIVGSVVSQAGLVPSVCRVHVLEDLPRTVAGKPDRLVAMAKVRESENALDADDSKIGDVLPEPTDALKRIVAMVEAVTGRTIVDPGESFVSLGVDSMSYVETSVRLERFLGALPSDWHMWSFMDLERWAQDRSRTSGSNESSREPWPRLHISVPLRAASICAVVAFHLQLLDYPGGAHVLLVLAGFNLARFVIPIDDDRLRLTSGLRTAARIAVVVAVWVAINAAFVGSHSIWTALLVNNILGSSERADGRWQYWFFEVFVQLTVVVTIVLAVPAIRRWERRWQWWFPFVVMCPLLVMRFGSPTFGEPENYLFQTRSIAWLFVLGWLIAQSRERWQRVVVTVVAVMSIPGFFNVIRRDVLVLAGVLILVWVVDLPVPRWAWRAVAAIAASSAWIYLVHWQVWPHAEARLPLLLAYVVTLGSGIAVWAVLRRLRFFPTLL
ncbi:MAG: AMP-binding protein [Actinobacteria bacterium]|nr:AMP-binding protein [Actinomycetota bacterium]